MELMNLVASLTLDTTQFDKDVAVVVNTPLIMPDVKPTLDTKEYKSELKEAEDETNWFKEVMVGVWQGLKDALVAVGVTGVISGVINYMRQGVSLAVKNGDAIEKGAKNLQLSTRAYQEYEYALGKSNLRITDLTKAMSTFDQIRGGSATKAQVEYLGKLGINAEQATSGLMSAEQMLDSVMGALADYKGADKGAIIDAFFGKSANWTGYFDKTSAEIDGLKKEAEELGLVMSEESIKNAVAFQDANGKLADRLEAIQRSFGEGILPLITEAVNKLMMIVDFFTGSDTRTSSEKFTDLENRYQNQLNDIKATGLTAKTLAQTLLGMGDTSGMNDTQLAIWRGTAESLINMIPTLSGVIDTENGTIAESVDGINELIDSYINLQKETAYQTSKAERENVLNQKRNKLTEEAVKENNKLAEAESKRTEAMDAFNDVLEKYGQNRLPYTATLEEIQKAQADALRFMPGDEYTLSAANTELTNAAKPLTDLLIEAQKAQTEVDKLAADIEVGEAEFAGWIEEQGSIYEATAGTAQAATADVNGLNAAIGETPTDVYTTFHILTDGEKPEGFAKGSINVPYDMPAFLHRGEVVLTKSQARRYRDGDGGVDYAYVAQLVGASVERAINKVNVLLNGDKVGDFTTKRINRNIRATEAAVLHGMGG